MSDKTSEKKDVDGELQLIASHDDRYMELRICSSEAINPSALMAVLEEIVHIYSEAPEKFISDYGQKLPPPSDLN